MDILQLKHYMTLIERYTAFEYMHYVARTFRLMTTQKRNQNRPA